MMPRLAAILISLLVLAAAGCGRDEATSETVALTSTEVILDWFPNADHAGLYMAEAEGYFSVGEHLAVTLTVPSDPAAAIKQVGAGRADFAISYEPEVLLARSRGIPVIAVGALVTHPLNSVIARADRGIARPRDLAGKTVGATGLPSDRALLETVIRADGGDPGDVKVQNVGFTLAPALAAGRVDALIGAYWNIEAPELAAKDVPVEVFRLEDYGVPDYDELVVITSDAFARERPERVRAFLRALAAGLTAAAADPEAAAAAVVAANPDLDEDLVVDQVKATAPLFAPPDAPPLALDPADWQRYADWMAANDLLTEPVTVTEAVTAEFLPEAER